MPFHRADSGATPERSRRALSKITATARPWGAWGATVSTCSATDPLAAELGARTGAAVETMEGAAIGLACAAAGVPWAQLRAVSNLTGDRARAGWDLARAVGALHGAIRAVLATPGAPVTQG